jgi:hypothetical protein
MKHLLLISLLLTGSLFADFKVGETLPAITLPDQFDKEFTVDAKDKLLIMAFEKDISVVVNDYLKSQPKTFLETHHAKYISDISTMPSFVTSMFALPKMKKYPFSVMLINNNFGNQFNRQKGKITVYTLKNNKIQSIDFFTPIEFPLFFAQ